VPFIVTVLPVDPSFRKSEIDEVVWVNVVVGELVPSEAATILEPAAPAGTIIVAENAPRAPPDLTDGGLVAIGLPSNVNEITCEGIKSEPDIVTIVPVDPFFRLSEIDEVVWVNVAV